MSFRSIIFVLAIICCISSLGYAQSTTLPGPTSPIQGSDNSIDSIEMPKAMRETLQRQRTAKAKKDHEEMVKRGETASQLAEQLSASFDKNKSLTPAEIKKLDQLEKLVTRIRRDLGGSDNKNDEEELSERSSSVKEAIGFLKTATADLFAELKKTSRFTISAAAIQTSNSIIRLARFLRLR